MTMRWLVALALLVCLGAVAWWLTPKTEPEPVHPVAEPEPAAAPPIDAAPSPVVVARAEVVDAGAVLAVADAGPKPIEVVVEVFGAEGHAAGAGVSFHAEPSDRYRRWEAMRDPDMDFGPAVGSGRTNVMGFTTIELPPGRWRVKPHAEPQYVVVREQTRDLVVRLRRPHVVRGIVLNEKGAGVPNTRVTIHRDLPGVDVVRGLGIVVGTGPDGRFAYKTFDSVLTLTVEVRPARSDLVFRKRIDVPSPEVKLYAGALGQVQLEVSGVGDAPVAVEFDAFGVVGTEVAGGRRIVSTPPGHVAFRARAAVEDQRFAGAAEADVKAGETVRLPLAMHPAPGQRVHVVDTERRPVAEVRVELHTGAALSVAKTNTDGDAIFEPGVSGAGAGRLTVSDRCIQPAPFLGPLVDEVTLTVIDCPPDAGTPGEEW